MLACVLGWGVEQWGIHNSCSNYSSTAWNSLSSIENRSKGSNTFDTLEYPEASNLYPTGADRRFLQIFMAK
jgi:hypothetical protein